MHIHKFFSKIVSFIKHEPFVLDKNIPIGYLLMLFLHKAISLIFGIFKLRRFGKFFIAPSSSIYCPRKIHCLGTLNIGVHCHIDALSTQGIEFGKNVSIGERTVIECTGSMKNLGIGLKVGNNVGLGTHGFFGCAGGIEIGDDCIFGNFVSMHSENHNFTDINTPIRKQGVSRKGIIVGKDCWIGAKVTILDGARIGNGCVVAAGAVVRGDIPPYSVIGGIPARVLKKRS